MDNETASTSPQVKPVAITEADVAAWLRARAATYGIKDLSLEVTGREESSPCSASVPKAGNKCAEEWGFGKTFDEAVASLRKKIKSADEVVAELRANAAKLLAEAAAIENANTAAATMPLPIDKEAA